jgi:hypothetical protein
LQLLRYKEKAKHEREDEKRRKIAVMERRRQEQASMTKACSQPSDNVKRWKWRVPQPRISQMTFLIIFFALFKSYAFHKKPWRLFHELQRTFNRFCCLFQNVYKRFPSCMLVSSEACCIHFNLIEKYSSFDRILSIFFFVSVLCMMWKTFIHHVHVFKFVQVRNSQLIA